MEVKFTVDQLNAILAIADQVPYRFAKPIIEQIQMIAGPQIAAQQQQDQTAEAFVAGETE